MSAMAGYIGHLKEFNPAEDNWDIFKSQPYPCAANVVSQPATLQQATTIHRDVTPVSHLVADLILRLELPPPILDSDPDYGFLDPWESYQLPPISQPEKHDECDITSENAHFVDEKDYKNESSLSCDQNAGLAGAFAQMTLGVSRSSEQTALEEHMRKHAWEHGNADYMGVDSFDNIWKKICETLSTKDGEEESSTLKNVSNREPSSVSIENASSVVKSNLEELTPATPLQVPSSSKQTSITPPIEALVNPQKPESIKVVLPIHPEIESTNKLGSQKTDEQQEQKKEPVLLANALVVLSSTTEDGEIEVRISVG
uniref:(California timema) hypothetical protein n=1 Tax=Timema californicum TaxID=61474 RepID=A0A7R9J9M3_TIMCA|nr:unnamed protein product [Timema californicum]